jgi:hypothetical protein
LLVECQNVGLRSASYARDQRIDILRGGAGGEFPVPQCHVEGHVLAAHEGCGADPVFMPERKRQQQQRPAFRIVGDDDEGLNVFACTDLQLPRGKKVESLIGCREMPLIFQAAPDRLRLAEIAENIDAGDAARFRPRRRFRRSFDRGRHGHSKTCKKGNIYIFRLRSTFAKKCQQRVMTLRPRRGRIRRIERPDVCRPISDF